MADWRFQFTGAEAAAGMRRWIHNRSIELERGEIRQAREALRNVMTFARSRDWSGMPGDVRRQVKARIDSAWNAVREPDVDPALAQIELSRVMELL
jgi:hypothetical protein